MIFLLCFSPQAVFCSESQMAGKTAQTTYHLSVDDVAILALSNNFDIQLARYDAQIAQTDESVAESIYDTILSAEIKYRNDQLARTSSLLGTKVIDNDYNLGLQKKLPTGTTVDLDMTNNRNWTSSSFASFNPSHDSALSVAVTQELGRNFFGLKDRNQIKITKLDVENSGYASLDEIEVSLAQTQKAYWDLVLAIENKRIEGNMVEQAQKLYEINQEKIKDGRIELPELYASEANYKNRLNDLQLAENDLQIKRNKLKLLLNIELSQSALIPKDSLSLNDQKLNLDGALETAFLNRRDYQKALNRIDQKKLNLIMKKNSLWPQIDLTASFTQNGLGDHFKQAVTNISDESNPDVYAGIVFSFPLENTQARAQVTAAELEKAKAMVQVKYTERIIATDIVDQVRSCNIFLNAARRSKEVEELQRKKYQAEEKRFRYGRSDTDTIIRFQDDYLQAQRRSAKAKHRYQSALIDLKKMEGSLLNQYWEDEKTL